MKKLILTGVIFAASITLVSAQSQSCDIMITPKTTIHQLDSMMTMLKKQNIFLDFSKLEYVEGKLVKLKGSVAVNSPKGTPNATFGSEDLSSYEIKVGGTPVTLSVSGK